MTEGRPRAMKGAGNSRLTGSNARGHGARGVVSTRLVNNRMSGKRRRVPAYCGSRYLRKAGKQAEAKASASRPVSSEVVLQTTIQGGRTHVMPQGYADSN